MMATTLPVMRPRLASADRLVPYLREIDRRRIYSNCGPLVLSLEERLSAHYGLADGTVASVANATLGLVLALTAQGVRPGTLCMIPAWTFVASAHAAAIAGLIPFFVDVDADTWALDPERILDAIAAAPGEVGAVMPVAPFGRPIDMATWEVFHSRTGVPVVVDAAAGFDGLRPGTVPAVVSLHATKVFGVGEGGFVISRDESLVDAIRTRSNFGFSGSREAVTAAMNAKLSEYHAAIGLAALDEWDSVRSEWMAVARAYREASLRSNRLWFQDGFGDSWISSTCVVRLTDVGSAQIDATLGKAHVETRRWWGNGAHAHPVTAAYPRTVVPVTERLVDSTIGLPFFRDLDIRSIERIVELVHAEDRALSE